MGGMGGPKPCMMGGPHMGPRMMPGPNLNAMNGKKLSILNQKLVSIFIFKCVKYKPQLFIDQFIESHTIKSKTFYYLRLKKY